MCHDLSLGLMTKERGCKVVGQKGKPGVMPHVPGSAKELPLWELESTEFLEHNCRGQNPLHWRVFYIIGKLLKRRCLEWSRMTHLEIWNTSYGQKKGHESNWQFDSQPLKVEDQLDFLACRWHATCNWKDLDKGYNFGLDLISIRGLHTKLWGSKIMGVPTLAISGDSHLGVPGQKIIWMQASQRGA
jgi:hypothetical protein